MRTIGYFMDLEDAVKFVQGKGVMGVGDGEVFEVNVCQKGQEPSKYNGGILVYGYRKARNNKWS